MKIIGFVSYSGQTAMVLKGDSCLLNGRKPMFIPDWTKELGYTPCCVLRVSRLGKEISVRFAERYFDALAPGADFAALDLLREAQANGEPWTRALCFDYSLAIGEFDSSLSFAGRELDGKEYLLSPAEAVAEASKVMTIRQGDLIYIQQRCASRLVQPEEIIHADINGEEKLYCKIK